MQKCTSLAVAAILAASLCACGANPPEPAKISSDSSVPTQAVYALCLTADIISAVREKPLVTALCAINVQKGIES